MTSKAKHDFTTLPDLASRELAAGVVGANDEKFAECENLIKPEPATHAAHEFGHKGKTYDGWETRRRREPGHDWAIVRLGAPGIVRGVVVDTAFFKGNYPPYVSVEATSVEGYPSLDELAGGTWTTLVEKAECKGDSENLYDVSDKHRWTHIRLTIYPDGGVARFRVHGEVVPDPRFMTGTVDLAALENGGRLVSTSDAFYSSPGNIIKPGRARIMGEGWENARRRDEGNDFATFALAAPGVIDHLVIDTMYFVGNAPGWVKVSAADVRRFDLDDESAWAEILPRTRVQPDTRHRFLATFEDAVTHVRLDVYPDGGLTRFRVNGHIDEAGLAELRQRWWDSLPAEHQAQIPNLAP
jgi:allantoicase